MNEHVMSKSVVKGVMHDCGVFGKQMTTFPLKKLLIAMSFEVLEE